MSGGIYLIQDDGQLVEMIEQSYGSESLLQELLETYPNLLSSERGDRDPSARWLAVVRDTPAAIEDERGDRWAFDRIFLDREGVPTLVEVNCSTQLRVQREIAGQLVGYAADISLYWTVETMVGQFEANCRDTGRDPEQVFEQFLGSDEPEEWFWQQVKTNLQAGRIRLVFVSDEISPELRRTVEFLNEQMDPAEVLAVEIKQYASRDGLKTLVPRTIGRTAEANKKKVPTSLERRRWDEESFFHEFALRQGDEEADIAFRLYEWCLGRREIDLHWRTGDAYGGFVAAFEEADGEIRELFKVGIDGGLEIVSSDYAAWPPFADPACWAELRNRLSAIGLSLPTDAQERRSPNFSLSTLQDETALYKVFDTFDWVLDRVLASRRGDGEGTVARRSPESVSW